jgi:trimeric autotransporter adhesin
MNSLIQLKKTTPLLLIALVLACFGLLPQMQAVLPPPPPDGCYPGFTTAEGCRALESLTTGTGNTGLGFWALTSDTTGRSNTAVGAQSLAMNNGDLNTGVGTVALVFNLTGTENTAVGAQTLPFNDADDNCAFGAYALFANIHAYDNTAVGDSALFNNDASGNGTAVFNTGVGSHALFFNVNGRANTAVGVGTLVNNTVDDLTAVGAFALNGNSSGIRNTAVGTEALVDNTTGDENTSNGWHTLQNNNDGSFNTAMGVEALGDNVAGLDNTAIGWTAGSNITSSGNIDIGSGAVGLAGDNGVIRIGGTFSGGNACYIRGIQGKPAGVGAPEEVGITPDGKLFSPFPSSRRFKHDIKPMEKASEVILALKPVTFHLNTDPANTPSFGLIAEEVAEVAPDLVILDKEGKPYTVRYREINAMLLNEFLKEHHQVQDLKAIVAQQQKQIETLTAGLQKVSAQLEVSKPAPQVVNNP